VLSLAFLCARAPDDDDMDHGQGGGQTSKPHGNPYPRRGDIKKKIIKEWTGGDNSGGQGGSTTAGYAGARY
jgi:hypothetical protein